MSNENSPPLRLSCTHCGFSREVPRDKVPPRPVRATCPRCKEAFIFDPAASGTPPQAEEPTPPPTPQPSRPEPPAPPPHSPPRQAPQSPRRTPAMVAGGTGSRGIGEPPTAGRSNFPVRWVFAAIGAVVLLAAIFTVFGLSLPGRLLSHAGKGGSKTPAVEAGSQQPSAQEGEWRVIPIPGKEGQQSSAMPSQSDGGGAAVQASSPLQADTQSDKAPENIHVFIYAVNCGGRVLANGVELKQIEEKPDTQYNYNLFGDKLRLGQNTITVEYSPLAVTGNMLTPKIHIKISQSSGGKPQVLGDWRVEETSAGQKSFDLEIPAASAQR